MTTDAPEVFQCPACERQYAASGDWVIPPRICVPVMRDCGAEDCDAVKLANAERLVAARQSRREGLAQRRAQRKGCSKGRPSQMHQRSSEAAQCHRGMPPERDDAEVNGSDLSHAEQQAEFASGQEATTQNEAMLAELLKTFDLHDPTRTARSRWVTNKEWQERFGITRPNSRASQLNGSDTLEQHPIIKMHRLFVDSRIMPGTAQVWERSLCYVEHSLFRARDRRKEDEHQMEIQTA